MNLNEEKIPEIKKETEINSTSETVTQKTKEEEKSFRPIFTNSSKNNENNDVRKTSTEVEKIIIKKEENIIQYKIINDYFKVIDKSSTNASTKFYDVDYLMKFRNVSSIYYK